MNQVKPKPFRHDPFKLVAEVLLQQRGQSNPAYEPKGIVDEDSKVLFTISPSDPFCYLYRAEPFFKARAQENSDQEHIARPHMFAAQICELLRLLRLEELLATHNVPYSTGNNYGSQVSVKDGWLVVDADPSNLDRYPICTPAADGTLALPELDLTMRSNNPRACTMYDALHNLLLDHNSGKYISGATVRNDLWEYEYEGSIATLCPFGQRCFQMGLDVVEACKKLPFINNNPVMDTPYYNLVRMRRVYEIMMLTQNLVYQMGEIMMEMQATTLVPMTGNSCIMGQNWQLHVLRTPPMPNLQPQLPRVIQLTKTERGYQARPPLSSGNVPIMAVGVSSQVYASIMQAMIGGDPSVGS